MTPSQTRAMEILKNGFCHEYYAKDADGLSVDIDDAEACQWCLVGAMRLVKSQDGQTDEAEAAFDFDYEKVTDYLKKLTGDSWGITSYNDTHTQAEVIAMLMEVWA